MNPICMDMDMDKVCKRSALCVCACVCVFCVCVCMRMCEVSVLNTVQTASLKGIYIVDTISSWHNGVLE